MNEQLTVTGRVVPCFCVKKNMLAYSRDVVR